MATAIPEDDEPTWSAADEADAAMDEALACAFVMEATSLRSLLLSLPVAVAAAEVREAIRED